MDAQSVVDDIQTFLYSSVVPNNELLSRTAYEYQTLCETANERLRQCTRLIRRGLRSEAIQQCEVDPNLIDLVATLDFAEHDQWRECLRQNSMSGPPPLLVDLAAELNEGYAADQPLQTLLSQHRLLAIARAPLQTRIGNLRNLARADAGNPIWIEDLQAYEEVRLSQLEIELGRAERNGDVHDVDGLLQELIAEGWTMPPPEALVQRARRIVDRLAQQRACEEMMQLASRLDEACTQCDIESGRRLRQRWLECLPVSGLQAHDSQCLQAARALSWLDDQDRADRSAVAFNEDLTAFETAMDNLASQDELEDACRRAESHGFAMPDALTQRYEKRLSELERQTRRRRWAKIAAAAVAVLALIAGGWLYADRKQYQQQVSLCGDTLRRLLAEDQIDRARETVQQQTPAVLSHESIVPLVSELDARLARDQQRQDQFQTQLDLVVGSLEDAEPDWNTLAAAESLIKTTEERDRWGNVSRQAREAAKATINLQAQGCEDYLDKLTVLKDSDYERGLAATKSVAELLGKLRGRAESIDDGLVTQLDGLLSGVTKQEQRFVDARLRADSEQAMRDAIGDPNAFGKALRQHAANLPNDPRSRDFQRVAEDQPLWEAVNAWSALAIDWAREPRYRTDPSFASEMVKRIQTINDEYKAFPMPALFATRRPFLERLGNRRGEKQADGLSDAAREFKEALAGPLSLPLLSTASMVEDTRGRRFYTDGLPPANGEQVTILCFRTWAGDSVQSREMTRSDIRQQGSAPHVALVGALREQASKLTDTNWEETFVALANRVAASKGVDPVLQIFLLHEIIAAACKGSHACHEVYSRHLQLLNLERVDRFANWMDPDNEQGNDARKIALTVLDQMPDWRSSGEKAIRTRDLFDSPAGSRTVWIGWLTRDTNSGWRLVRDGTPIQLGKLFVVRSQADGGSRLVGEAEGDAIRWDREASGQFLEGLPVFVSKSAEDTETPRQ